MERGSSEDSCGGQWTALQGNHKPSFFGLSQCLVRPSPRIQRFLALRPVLSKSDIPAVLLGLVIAIRPSISSRLRILAFRVWIVSPAHFAYQYEGPASRRHSPSGETRRPTALVLRRVWRLGRDVWRKASPDNHSARLAGTIRLRSRH